MYAIAFDLNDMMLAQLLDPVSDDPPAWARRKIADIMFEAGFDWWYGSFFVAKGPDALATIYSTLDNLRGIEWFVHSLEECEVFRISDVSSLKSLIKAETGVWLTA